MHAALNEPLIGVTFAISGVSQTEFLDFDLWETIQ